MQDAAPRLGRPDDLVLTLNMCGIAGIIRFDDRPIERERLERMLGHIRHRGPDGSGIAEYPRCGLVHTRLSIIDLLGGQQPMHVARHDDHGPLHLVFNGEIYNHRYLRKRLTKRGHAFSTDHSDTEVLLLGYREWGRNLPKHLHGMFAFAIWDEDRRELFMARDRAGKKPLYVRRDGDELAFASLIGTLIAGGADKPPINRDALLNYLQLGYTFGQSLFDNVVEIPAANWMCVAADGRIEYQRYWQPPPISRHSTALGAVDALREVLTEAVQSRLESDVPLGCFLSGGIDSSITAAIAQQCLKERGDERLKTFSVAMPDIAYDESEHAAGVARLIDAEHTVLMADPSDAVDDLERLMAITGEPNADSSLLPTHWLCRAARQHVKAAISGDGGDELFGGYDRYRALRLLQTHRWWVRALPASLLDSIHAKSAGARLARLVHAARAGADPSAQYRRMIRLFAQPDIVELAPDLAPGLNHTPPLPDWPEEYDQVHAAMRWDLVHYLPFELLRKVDRASMAVALEVRCPLLDTPVLDLAGHLPAKVLMPGGRPKGLLRTLAAEYLPRDIVQRPKQGFAVPIGSWFRGRLREPLTACLQGDELSQLGLDPTHVRRYLDEHLASRADHTHRLFALLQLAFWARWLNGL